MVKAADIVGPITLTVLVASPLWVASPPLNQNRRLFWRTECKWLSCFLGVELQASQVTNRDQFAVTQVTIEVTKKSRNPPRFERERYEGFIYSTSVPESMVLRDRTSNRPYRVRAADEDFANVSGML